MKLTKEEMEFWANVILSGGDNEGSCLGYKYERYCSKECPYGCRRDASCSCSISPIFGFDWWKHDLMLKKACEVLANHHRAIESDDMVDRLSIVEKELAEVKKLLPKKDEESKNKRGLHLVADADLIGIHCGMKRMGVIKGFEVILGDTDFRKEVFNEWCGAGCPVKMGCDSVESRNHHYYIHSRGIIRVMPLACGEFQAFFDMKTRKYFPSFCVGKNVDYFGRHW